MKSTSFLWILTGNILLLGLMTGYVYLNQKSNRTQVCSLSQQIQTLQDENQRLSLSLENLQKIQKNAASEKTTAPEPLAAQTSGISVLQTVEPNRTAIQNAQASDHSLNVLRNALRQIQKSNGRNDANELARFQEENNSLKEEIARLQSLLNLRQTSDTVLTEIQTQQQQTQILVTSVLNELNGNISPAQKIQLLDSMLELAGNQDPALLPIIQQGLSDSNPEVRQAAVDILGNYHSTDAIPLLSTALDAPDTETRLAAIESFENIQDPAVTELFLKAINDKVEDIRAAAVGKTDKQSDDIQFAVYEAGIKSSYADVKTETLSCLELRGDHKSVDIVIEGLKDADSDFVEAVNSTLSFLIDKEFKNYEEAANWWAKNKNKYDENLMEK